MRLKSYSDKRELRSEGYFKELCSHVCKHMMIHKNKIGMNSGRKKKNVQARNMVCAILNGNDSHTLHEIAQMVGYKSHASVLHAIKMHEIDMGFDKRYVSVYNGAISELEGSVEGDLMQDIIKRITALEKKVVNLQKCLTK
tara:strand:+ start:919 stop:1341 length:423 start_codon:yes stop_codon:yes gene_type:complete